MTQPPTVSDLLARATAAYEALVALGEEVEDEWGYVQDLAGAWRTLLGRAADRDGGGAVTPPMLAAVDRLVRIGGAAVVGFERFRVDRRELAAALAGHADRRALHRLRDAETRPAAAAAASVHAIASSKCTHETREPRLWNLWDAPCRW